MGDKKTLKALGEAFCTEVKNRIGEKYKGINMMMKILMTHINRNKDSTIVIDTVNSIEKELRIKGEHIPKISDTAKNLRAFWVVENQVGITGRGLDKKDGSSPNTTNPEDQSSELKLVAKAANGLGTAEANKQEDGSSPNTTNPEDESSELKLIAMAAEGLGTAEANKQEDINRLKTENQYLREALEGLHQGIHGGDETALTKSRKPQETKTNPTCKELEVKIKDIADTFHVTKTELEYTYSKINSLFTKMDVIEKEAILSPNVINKILAHGGTTKNNVLQKPEQPQRSLHLKEDLQAVESAWADMKGKQREAEYTFRLLEELNKYSGCEGTQGTANSLPEPPIQHERPGSKERQRVAKQKYEEKPRSGHDEQLMKSFITASSVLEKLSEAEYIARLLEELYKYSNYEGKHDTPIGLHKPPIQKARASSKDKKREYKKQYEENPYSRHDEKLQKNFEGASSVLEKLINGANAQGERDCLFLSLEHLSHIRDPSGGNTEVNIMTTLDLIQSSVKKESSANKGLVHAKEILYIYMDLKREAEYTARLLEELNKYTTYSGKQDTQNFLTEPPIQLTLPSSKVGKMDAEKQNDENPRWRHVEQLQINFKSASSVLEKLSELDNVYRRISQISTLFSENEGGYVSQSPPKIDKIAATGRKGRSIPFQRTDQSQQALQFEKDVELITITFNYLKEKKS